ncbi:unnamed protein product [Candidula unifasciata]|uniref:Uncharacterized protein n=1 Tax=Candidula unifasciata TaxID=100452 RepID=A0A8S3ZRA9_9EUPU|nr:unnamed protein product [Candidula unifasciata]
MNQTTDPCVDFHEFACGRYSRETVIPKGYTQVTTFTSINDQNQLVMKDIISSEITADEPKYLQNMKRFYKSCMDVAQIEKTGLAEYFKDPYSKDWPTIKPEAWDKANFHLNDLIARYVVVNTQALFGISASLDYKNSSRKVLFLHDPQLGLSQEYYSLPRNDSRILAYQKFIRDITVVLGANETTAEEDATDIVDFEIALSKIMVSKAERQNLNKVYNPVNMSQLMSLYPGLDIPRTIRALYGIANVTIPDDETVINMYPTYMEKLHETISNFSGRVVQNLFSFRYALGRIQDLSSRMREVRLDYDKVTRGKTEETPRWQSCLSSTSSAFWKGMSKQFVTRTFSETAKNYVEEMIDNLKTSFHQIIEEITWMAPPTKQAAYTKLAAMTFKIGYPDANFTHQEIETKYEQYQMQEDNYYSNWNLILTLSRIDSITSFRKPVDKNEWRMPPHDVNAYYSVSENEIAFLAGILQPPVFSQAFPDYINYGAIGMVIGHEITHGFDSQGSQFDSNGNLVNWWQPSDLEVFQQKAQCIRDQCSSFRMDEINMTLNGVNIHRESIADNGGLKESFGAYKKLVAKKGENPKLPVLGLTQDQLFFLAFGQFWCEKTTKESLINIVTSGTHPPGKFRIIGSLQNSEDFAKAYKCPRGSYMNPEKKCAVW